MLPDDLAQREPALAAMAQAAVTGLPPAGPELRRRPTLVALPGRPGVTITAPLSVAEAGFTLHAATRAGADDERGRLALCKYVLRPPPIAYEHVNAALADDLVRIALKRPFRDGTVAVDMDPLSLLCRLCTMVPPPRQHRVRYAGVLAANAKWRPLVVPPSPRADQPAPAATAAAPDRKPPGHRCTWVPFIRLLKDALAIDLERCPTVRSTGRPGRGGRPGATGARRGRGWCVALAGATGAARRAMRAVPEAGPEPSGKGRGQDHPGFDGSLQPRVLEIARGTGRHRAA